MSVRIKCKGGEDSPLVNKTLFENACELEWVVLYFKEPPAYGDTCFALVDRPAEWRRDFPFDSSCWILRGSVPFKTQLPRHCKSGSTATGSVRRCWPLRLLRQEGWTASSSLRHRALFCQQKNPPSLSFRVPRISYLLWPVSEKCMNASMRIVRANAYRIYVHGIRVYLCGGCVFVRVC